MRKEVEKLAEQLKLRLERRLDVPSELIERAEILVHHIQMQFEI